jgi:hypothetical protein
MTIAPEPGARPSTLHPNRWQSALGIFVGGLSVVLFCYTIWVAGPRDVAARIGRLGPGFIWILAVSGLRFALRASAWVLSVEPPNRLPFSDALSAAIAAEAAGNLTPLGPLATEPTRSLYVRRSIPLAAAVASVLIDNLYYVLSVIAVLIAGGIVILVRFPLGAAAGWIAAAAIITVVLIGVIAGTAWRRTPSLLSGALATLVERQPRRLAFLEARLDGVRDVETKVLRFSRAHPKRVLLIVLHDAAFHAAAVAEVYLTLLLVSSVPPTLFSAFVLETVDRVVTVAFKFVPMRMGVDETGSGFASGLLDLGVASGVTIALVRKARVICWTAVGVLFLVRRGLERR